jgi:2-methylisocitrate lyase-like PEP mutase family enzyme
MSVLKDLLKEGSGSSIPPAQKLRELLAASTALCFPACFDALSAKLVRNAGFSLSFVSGFMVAATRLGMPDTGLITFTEMLDQLRNICNAVPGFPIIADGDTGYGNAINVRRTVLEFARAGAACVLIEDQMWPKRCGHLAGKQVIAREEARMKIRAAVVAAREADILILARTDARAPLGFQAALERCCDFQDEGADIIFMEALQNEQEMRDFCSAIKKPTIANMFIGGDAKYVSRQKLEKIGFKLMVDPTLLFAATRAMIDTLSAMAGGNQPPPPLVSFEEIVKTMGFEDYSTLETRYRVEE